MPIPLIVWAIGSAAAAFFASGCSDNKEKGNATESDDANALKNSTDEYLAKDKYLAKCDGAAKRFSTVAACFQFPHQWSLKQYPSSTSVYVPVDGQWNVNQLISSGKCVINCAWWTPDQPKYKETSGLCEYLLVVPRENTNEGTGYFIYETEVLTEKSKASNYFEYCLGHGYLP